MGARRNGSGRAREGAGRTARLVRSLRACFLVCASVGASACAPASRVNVPELARQALDAARIETFDAPAAALSASGPRVLVRDAEVCQSVEFARGAERLVLVTYAARPGDGELRAELDAGFALDAVAAKRGDELFVAGRTRDGRTRIERWNLRAGTIASRRVARTFALSRRMNVCTCS